MPADSPEESLATFLARAKQASNQRKYNADYALVNPNHDKTLLMREVDQMNEDEILSIFYPNYKDDIVGIRLFPPIPGTRGFCFLDFKDASSAIRAFSCKHRQTISYKGTPKKLNLSRVTKGTTTDDESKWLKYQDRIKRNAGRVEFDSTPRRMALTPSGRKPADDAQPTDVQTVPFSEITKAQASSSSHDAEASPTPASPTDKPAAEGESTARPPAREMTAERDRDRAGLEERRPRDASTERRRSPGRTRSPPRPRSPPRDRRPADRNPFDNRRGDDRRDERRPADRDPFSDPRDRRDDRRYDDRRGSDRRDDRRTDDRRPDSRRDPFDERRPSSSYDSRRETHDERGSRARDVRDDYDDRKRRRLDDNDEHRGRSSRDDDRYRGGLR
eukprot:GGOE01036676.1.p1 GENE.GGOE01036676.1~~GGOE01036676.1.p1  ORF type:complete len:401 (+),score=30.00 GGOE01036676.1:38-1204(+)